MQLKLHRLASPTRLGMKRKGQRIGGRRWLLGALLSMRLASF